MLQHSGDFSEKVRHTATLEDTHGKKKTIEGFIVIQVEEHMAYMYVQL